MEGPGLGRRGREARLLNPLVFVMAVGGERVSRYVGIPVHQKGLDGPCSPSLGALSIRRQIQCRPRRRLARGAHLSAVMARLYGPFIRGPVPD